MALKPVGLRVTTYERLSKVLGYLIKKKKQSQTYSDAVEYLLELFDEKRKEKGDGE